MKTALCALVAAALCAAAAAQADNATSVVSFFSPCPQGTSVCYATSASDFDLGCTKIGGQVGFVLFFSLCLREHVGLC